MEASNEDNVKQGRPTKYDKKYDKLVYKLCLLGAIDEEIAEVLEIATSTLYEWKRLHHSFSESITKGKTIADAEIAESLFNRSKGYSVKEIKVESSSGINGDDLFNAIANDDEDTVSELVSKYGVGKVVTTKKHIPADVAAAFIWLKNRRPKEWKDKREIEANLNKPAIILKNGLELPNDD